MVANRTCHGASASTIAPWWQRQSSGWSSSRSSIAIATSCRGGERQKVYIARAIAQETEALLLDEPTSALDPKNQMEVLQAVRDITTQTSLATVMVIHDVNLAVRFCDRFVLMRNGEIIARGGIDAVTNEALSRTYDMPMRIVDVDNTKLAIPDAS